jgi:HK97 family phage major capsid protein
MGPLLGLSRNELTRYGLADLVLALSAPPFGVKAARTAPVLEHFRSMSTAVDILCGREVLPHGPEHPHRFSLPGDMFRTMTAQPGSAGGYLVGTDVKGYVSNLRNRGVLAHLPVKRLDGLAANVTLVRGNGSVTASWQAVEGTPVTPTDLTLGQLSLTPKALVVIVELSTQLMHALGAAANAYVLGEIDRAVAEELDRKFLAGAGGSEPIGMLNSDGINTQAGASLSWASTTDMLRLAELSAEGDSLAWIVAPDAAKVLRTRERASGNGGFILNDGTIAGYPARVTSAMPAGALVLAPWDDVTVATWGSVQLEATPFSSAGNFNKGIVAVRMIVDTDWVAEKPATVTKATSIT